MSLGRKPILLVAVVVIVLSIGLTRYSEIVAVGHPKSPSVPLLLNVNRPNWRIVSNPNAGDGSNMLAGNDAITGDDIGTDASN